MKNNRNFRNLLALLLAAVMCLSLIACGEAETDPAAGAESTDPVVVTPENPDETVTERSLVLNSGDSAQLTVNYENVTFVSSDTAVATVDANGNVAAVGKGTALITATCGEAVDYCGVLVGLQGELIDITKLEAKALFSDLLLNAQTEITGMGLNMENGTVYFCQSYAPSSYGPQSSDLIVTQVKKNGETWTRGSWMRFYESGMGYMGLETEGGKDLLWLESGGSIYGTGIAVSRVEWADEACLRTAYGDTITLEDTQMPGPSVDAENDLLVVIDQVTGEYVIYDRGALLAGEPAVALHRFDCASRQTPAAGEDDSQGRYNASLQGFALADGYLYQISGKNSVYVSVFDLNGNLQYCQRLEDYPELTLRHPAAITVVDGKLYVTMQSGSTACYLANLWVYDLPETEAE